MPRVTRKLGLGQDSGRKGTLNISGGWLRARNGIVVGSGSGYINLTGGTLMGHGGRDAVDTKAHLTWGGNAEIRRMNVRCGAVLNGNIIVNDASLKGDYQLGADVVVSTNTGYAASDFYGRFTGSHDLKFNTNATVVLHKSSSGPWLNTGFVTWKTNNANPLAGNNNIFSNHMVANVSSGYTLSLNGTSQAVGGLVGGGNANLGGGTLTVGDDTDSGGTFSGMIDGDGTLNKVGTDTLILGDSANHAGIATIDGGTLVVNGVAGDITVGANGTLTGRGQVHSALVDGLISPGDGVGVLSVDDFHLMSEGILRVDILGSVEGDMSDQVNVLGEVRLAGELDVSLQFPLGDSDEFVVLTNDGTDAIIGGFSGLGEGDTVVLNYGGVNYERQITYMYDWDSRNMGTGNDIALVVPEPATLSLLALGGLAIVRRRRHGMSK